MGCCHRQCLPDAGRSYWKGWKKRRIRFREAGEVRRGYGFFRRMGGKKSVEKLKSIAAIEIQSGRFDPFAFEKLTCLPTQDPTADSRARPTIRSGSLPTFAGKTPRTHRWWQVEPTTAEGLCRQMSIAALDLPVVVGHPTVCCRLLPGWHFSSFPPLFDPVQTTCLMNSSNLHVGY